MSATAQDETLIDEERRAPPVSLAEVLAACREIEMERTPVTRRSVREKLGRGSMTTIHNGVTQYESRREPQTPTIDLTQEDRSVIADLGARALAIAEGRVERILAEREAALQTQITAANARADDAIAAAEAMVSEAQSHTLEALAASEVARSETDKAIAAAEADRQHALRLEGQVQWISADKIAKDLRWSEIETELVAAKAQLAAEMALRQQRDEDIQAIRAELGDARAELTEKVERSQEALARTKEALASEQSRLAEVTHSRRVATEMIERLESELSTKASDLAKILAELAAAKVVIKSRDEKVREISATLTAEQEKAQDLLKIVATEAAHAEALRALEQRFSSFINDPVKVL